ncbi:MAG TPA: SRPBCC family protein [Burkholderiaceae bacterium]|jgi:carbon monoxide dehydrogenase subunit G|nr:SRPBCC family protein [Burkholderiaceae bacterium]
MLKFMTIVICFLAFATGAAAEGSPDDIKVKVQKDGDSVIIDLTVTIPATPQETWAVLTDFDHMTQFLSNLQSSKILEKNGDKLKVAQKGQSSHGGFSFSFESIREVELKPFETIRSHLISGTMTKHEGLTQLFPSGSGTRIVYHAESIANVWVPPLVGTSLVEGDVRKQFEEMEAEISKRKSAAKAGS